MIDRNKHDEVNHLYSKICRNLSENNRNIIFRKYMQKIWLNR